MKSRTCLSTVLAAMLLAVAHGSAAAQPASGPASTGAWSLQYGADSDVHRLTVNYETPVWWSHQFNSSRIDLVGEFGLSYWRVHGSSDGPRNAWQASAIPMFQWWLTPRFF
nr:acyloxyacyl hydrolase [Pseudomonas sp.]